MHICLCVYQTKTATTDVNGIRTACSPLKDADGNFVWQEPNKAGVMQCIGHDWSHATGWTEDAAKNGKITCSASDAQCSDIKVINRTHLVCRCIN